MNLSSRILVGMTLAFVVCGVASAGSMLCDPLQFDVQLDLYRGDLGTDSEDIDGDGVPDLVMLQVMETIVCTPDFYDALGAIVDTVFMTNLQAVTSEDNVNFFADYADAMALMLAMSGNMQNQLAELHEAAGLFLTSSYTVIACDPADCADTGGKSLNEPFSGTGDVDNDGTLNQEEYANVVARGASVAEFIAAVLDPAQDGTFTPEGEGEPEGMSEGTGEGMSEGAGEPETVVYRVTFNATWSADTHPEDFPPNPHFSPLIGATHNGFAVFWQEGGFASSGIEEMAEIGGTSTLATEIQNVIATGQASSVINGPGVDPSPGKTSTTFEISESHPLVTLVSMIAPSPDWFVGVSGLQLNVNGVWLEDIAVNLLPYDAGTDDGATFLSPNGDTSPQQPIARISLGSDGPFIKGAAPPLGTFRFTLLTGAEGLGEGEGEPEGMGGEGEGEPEGMGGEGEGEPEGMSGEGAAEGMGNEGAAEGVGEGQPEGMTEGQGEGAEEGASEGGGEGDGSDEGMTTGCGQSGAGPHQPMSGFLFIVAVTMLILRQNGRPNGFNQEKVDESRLRVVY